MRIFVRLLNCEKHEIEVEGSTTIEELYCLVWKVCKIDLDPFVSAKNGRDGLAISWAGKRLRTRCIKEIAASNKLTVETILYFNGPIENNLADYNIQKDSTIYVTFYEFQARKRYENALKEDCVVCFESLSDMGIVGYRECENHHYFHSKCIIFATCPMCRNKF